MKQLILNIEPFPADRIPGMLEDHHIHINHYAEEYFAHSGFSFGQPGEMMISIASLEEIGFEQGATLDEIFEFIPKAGLKPCPPGTGVFLRLVWKDQPQSRNSVISGTHASPDQAVMVLSEILEQNDAFPKGLYLRNVEGDLWLRGYVCDPAYRFPGDALFAFQNTNANVYEPEEDGFDEEDIHDPCLRFQK